MLFATGRTDLTAAFFPVAFADVLVALGAAPRTMTFFFAGDLAADFVVAVFRAVFFMEDVMGS